MDCYQVKATTIRNIISDFSVSKKVEVDSDTDNEIGEDIAGSSTKLEQHEWNNYASSSALSSASSSTTNLNRSSSRINAQKSEYFQKVYQAASTNDVGQLSDLLEKEIETDNLEDSLARVCMKLQLNCVHLLDETKLVLERKLLDLRYFQKQKTDSGAEEIRERIGFTLKLIRNLCSSENAEQHMRGFERKKEYFIANLTFLAKQIFTLKGLLRSTYDRVPWEELEFCILSFIGTFKERNEFVIFSTVILTEPKIRKYLKIFGQQLEELHKEFIVTPTEIPNSHRGDVVKKIIDKYPEFQSLYTDHERLREIYSLNSILNYVNLIKEINQGEKYDKLILTRALQVIVENMKNTLESPNLSEITLNLLNRSLSLYSRQFIANILSKSFHNPSCATNKERYKFLKPEILSAIKNDINQMGEKIEYILFKSMINIVEQSLVEDTQIEKIMKNVHFKNILRRILSESENIDVTRLSNLISRLCAKVPPRFVSLKTHCEEMKDILKYYSSAKHAGFWKASFSVLEMVENFFTITETRNSSAIDDLVKKILSEKLKHLHLRLEEPKLISVMARLIEMNLFLWNDEVSEIFFEMNYIFYISNFRSECFTSVLRLNQNLTIIDNEVPIQENEETYEEMKTEIISELKKIFNDVIYFEYKNNEKLQAATEFLLFYLITIIQKSNRYFDNTDDSKSRSFFLDNDYPSLMWLDLRNHLAKHNVIMKVVLDPVIATFLFVEKLLKEEKRCQDFKLIDVMFHDLSHMNETHEYSIEVLSEKHEMFTAVKMNDFNKFSKYIRDGADIRSRDFNLSTCLHFVEKNLKNLTLIKFLREKGLFSWYINLESKNALHVAAARGNSEVFDFLMKKFNSEINDVDSFGKTAAHIAALEGRVPIIQKLFENKEDVYKLDKSGYSILHYAVVLGGINGMRMTEYLLSKDVDVNARAEGAISPLHLAATVRNLEIFETLIRYGANVNSCNSEGFSALHAACENNEEKIVASLLSRGADVNKIDFRHGVAPIHCAARIGHANIVEKLLRNKAININLSTKSGSTPLSLAVQQRNSKVVELLMNKEGIEVNNSDEDGMTPLLYAALNGETEIIKILLEAGANVNCINRDGLNALHLASQNGHESVVILLISKNVSSTASTKKCGYIPLHLAILFGNNELFKNKTEGGLNIVKQFLRAGCDINAQDFLGNTPLHMAMRINIEIADFLVEENADITIENKRKETSFDIAIKFRMLEGVNILLSCGRLTKKIVSDSLMKGIVLSSTDIVKLLLDLKTTLSLPTICYKNGFTLLHVAAHTGRIDMLQLLLKYNIPINSKYSDGRSPLHLAALRGHEEFVDILLKKGADMNVQDCSGNTPLHLASLSGHSEVVHILLNQGADVSKKNKNGSLAIGLALHKGSNNNIIEIFLKRNENYLVYKSIPDNWTLLHWASARGHNKLVKFLLDKRADMYADDTNGRKPIHLAAMNSFTEIIDIFLERGMSLDIVDKGKNSLLHLAAQEGKIDAVEYLVQRGCNVNPVNCKMETPLLLSSQSGHKEVVTFLLNNGPTYICKSEENFNEDIKKSFSSIENLFSYIENSNIEGFERVINEGVSSNCIDLIRGCPLHLAICRGDVDIVRMLLENNACANTPHINDLTPLHCAVIFSNLKIVFLLLHHGARYNVETNEGRTPIDMAENGPIRNLLQLINECFEKIRKKDINITDLLQGIQCRDTMKAIMRAENEDGVTLVTAALKNNFPRTELEGIFQKISFIPLMKVEDLIKEKKYKNAEKSLQRILKDKRNILQYENTGILGITNKIAHVLNKQKLFDEAMAIHKGIYKKLEKTLGHNHERSLREKSMVASTLFEQGKYEESSEIFKEVYQLQKRILPSSHEDLSFTEKYMALIYMNKGQLKIAFGILESMLETQENNFGFLDSRILNTKELIAQNIYEQGQYEKAEQLFREILERRRISLGAYHSDTLRTSNSIINIYLDQENHYKASEIIEELINDLKQHLGLNHLDTLNTQSQKAYLQYKQHRYIPAFKLFTEIERPLREILGANHDRIKRMAGIMAHIKNMYEALCLHRNSNSFIEDMIFSMHDAAKWGDMETIEKLIRSGMEIGEKNEEGLNCLHHAANGNNTEVMKYLLEHGLDITETTNDGKTVMHFACENGCTEIVRFIFNTVDDNNLNFLMNAATKFHKRTALHAAAERGNRVLVELLLVKGADLNCVDKDGKRAIDLTRNYEEVKATLEYIENLLKRHLGQRIQHSL